MNNGKRNSHYLSGQEVQLKLFDAGLYAFCLGQPLNRFITINFAQAGFAGDVHKAITNFLNFAGLWLLRHSEKPACYDWVIENALGAGLHVHIVIHVPESLLAKFLRRQRGWLRAAGIRSRKRVLKSKRLNGSETLPSNLPEYLGAGLRGLTRYLSKGLDPRHCPDFGVEHEPQGIVIGKRCGVSQTLSASHRAKRAGRAPKKSETFVFRPRGMDWIRSRILAHHGYYVGIPYCYGCI